MFIHDFFFIIIGGHLLLGSSNLTGRYWNGSVWYFDDPRLAPGVVEAKAGCETSGGVCDGIFINENSAVVGLVRKILLNHNDLIDDMI